ncbi:hypothetical protein AB0I53_26580 [Saccharopolyspora sp. NPDC050389]|uniref:hypothetical protein n=1 Tax=Saccharopolyspora sp. NPDC050389 TaxID=3155516 RepID=UPI00340A9527
MTSPKSHWSGQFRAADRETARVIAVNGGGAADEIGTEYRKFERSGDDQLGRLDRKALRQLRDFSEYSTRHPGRWARIADQNQ